jgi:hypothetical protein
LFFSEGFTVNNGLSLTNALSNNLNYDYINVNSTNTSNTERYIYRVQQTSMEVLNKSVPQLTVTLWSGQYFAFIRNVKKSKHIFVSYRSGYGMSNYWRKS